MIPGWDGTLENVHDHDYKHLPNISKDSRISSWEEQKGEIKIRISISFLETGIFGMDFDVVLTRAGKRVKQTKCRGSHVLHMQKMTIEEELKWSQSELGRTLLKYDRLVII